MAKTELPAIALHLGAHKTGTTFIQQTFLANRDALAAGGVAFVPLKAMRKAVTPAAVVSPKVSAAERDASARTAIAMLDEVSAAVEDCRSVIVSDENILGGAPGPRANGMLYPRLDSRLEQFSRSVLNGRHVTAYFCVRRYDRLLPSMYCEAIRHRPFFTFAELMDKFDLAGMSWRPIVRAMVGVFGEANLVLWDFDSFVADPEAVIAAIAGVPAETLAVSDDPRRRRPSASAEAIAALTALRPTMSDTDIQGQVRQIEKAYPVGEYPVFAPFPDRFAKDLAARHAADWEAIRRDFPKARYLG